MMTPLHKEAVVLNEHHGQRVDVVLASLFPDYSRSQLTHWLKNGSITINASQYKPKDKVRGGELVTLDVVLDACVDDNKPEDLSFAIVYEDEHLLVVNKPAGLVVHPGAGNREHTLVNGLLFHCPSLQSLPRAGIVHRLDKDTTGLLLVAKTLKAHTNLIRQMQARDIERHYLALVHGHVIGGAILNTGFGRHPKNRLKMTVLTGGKNAITHYALKKQFGGFTLLDVQLKTGRTHQIRVHMAHIHHPIVGDPLYGGRQRYPGGITDEVRAKLQQFKRQALHAATLSVHHPETGNKMTFEAPIPTDLKLLLTTLESNLA